MDVNLLSDGKSQLSQEYYGDEYPREGCKLELVVGVEKCSMSIYAPSGKILEDYLPPRNDCGRWVQEWLNGKPPRIKP